MRRCCLKECVGDEIIPEVIQPILARSVASILGPVPVQRVEADWMGCKVVAEEEDYDDSFVA